MSIDSGEKRVCALAATIVALGCGGNQQGTGFAPGSGSGAPGDAGGASSDDSSTLAADSGPIVPGFGFTSSDAAPAGIKFDCQPGTYSGMFKVHVSTDAGLLPALVSFDVAGTLSITLVGKVTQTGAGEFVQPILTIAPGAKLSGKDVTFGGTFNADVSGQLDCPKKTFNGTLTNGVYVYPSDSGSLAMDGSLSATYDGTMTPPALTMGVMQLGSPQLMLGSIGPWSATHQP
jgi:hypothetical protein